MEKRVTTEFLRLGDLIVEGIPYQRPLNLERVEEMAQDFRPVRMTLLTVSRRENGDCVVVQGQHRWHMMVALLGLDGLVECRVWEGLTLAEEAELFADEDETRRSTIPLDRYKAHLVAEHADALALRDLLERRGWQLLRGSATSTTKTLACTGQIREIVDRRGIEQFEQILIILEEAGWTITPTASLIDALDAFWARYRDHIKHPEAVGKFLLKRYVSFKLLNFEARTEAAKSNEYGVRVALIEEMTRGYNRSHRGNARLPVRISSSEISALTMRTQMLEGTIQHDD